MEKRNKRAAGEGNTSPAFSFAKIIKKLLQYSLTDHGERGIMYTTKGDKPNNERRKKMYIGNNYMVITQATKNGHYHNEYFIDEKSARDYANSCYKNGHMTIELLQRHRDGYHRVKRIVRKSENSELYEIK